MKKKIPKQTQDLEDGMTINSLSQITDSWTWRNGDKRSNTHVTVEMPMDVGERYSLVPIVLELSNEKTPFSTIIRRVDIINEWVFVLSEVKAPMGNSANVSFNLIIPYRRLEKVTLRVKHFIITNGLLGVKKSIYQNVTYIKSKKEYHPEKVDLPTEKPQKLLSMPFDIDYIDDETSQYELLSTGKCAIL
jgi:hypothetical protein